MKICQLNLLSLFSLISFTVVTACTESGIIIETNPEPIAEVSEIRLEITNSPSRQLIITAKGFAGSAGWTNPLLIPVNPLITPEDGIYEFQFRAIPPENASAAVLTSIEVIDALTPMPDDLLGVRVVAATNSKTVLLQNAEAYFEFKGADEMDRFLIKLTEQDKIQHARDLLSGITTGQASIMGTIVKGKVAYNADWSYYLDSESILFFDVAVEVCDAAMRYVEAHLTEVGNTILPDNIWCPWGSELTREFFISD